MTSPSYALTVQALVGALCLMCASYAYAQVGSIAGKVVDLDFGEPIPGAAILIESTGQRVTSDNSGFFVIEQIAPGSYNLIVTREGFVSEREEGIVVQPGIVTDKNLRLEVKVVTLETFVVQPDQAEEDSGLGALNIDFEVASIVDFVDKDLLTTLGPSDAGDILKKISGANVSDTGFVVIRGLDERYNSVTLNGLGLPSSDPDRRGVPIDIFPGGLIENLAVSKTFSPQLPGESTGGNVNVILKSMPDKNFFKFSVGITNNTQASNREDFVSYRGAGTGFLGTAKDREISLEETIPYTPTGLSVRPSDLDFSYSASGGIRTEFFGKPFGFVGAVTYAKKYDFDPNGIDADTNLSGRPGEVFTLNQTGEYYFDINSQEELLAGVLLASSWEYADDSNLGLTFFSNVAADDTSRFRIGQGFGEDIGAVLDPPETFDASLFDSIGGAAYRESRRYRERRLTTYQAFGEHALSDDGAKVTWGLATTSTRQDEPDLRSNVYSFLTQDGNFQFPGASELGFGEIVSGSVFRRSEDFNYTVNLGAEIPLFGDKDEDGQRSDLLFGGSFSHTTRDFSQNAYDGSGFIRQTAGPDTSSLVLGPADSLGLTPADIPLDEDLPEFGIPTVYFASQEILGAYIGVDSDVTEKFNMQVGFRAELTDIRVVPDLGIDTSDPSQIGLVGLLQVELPAGTATRTFEEIISPVEIQQTDVLPALSTTWELPKNMKLRSAISKTVARPSFKELALILSFLDPRVGGDAFIGNPDLQISSITNYDVRLEWEPRDGDTFAITGFTKDIQNPIELFNAGQFFSFVNEESAVVYGFELEASKALDDISPFLRNVKLSSNYAFIQSNVTSTPESTFNRNEIGASGNRRLQGQPSFIFNFNALYNNEDHGISGGLGLNILGENLIAVGGRSQNSFFPDIVRRPVTTLDASVSKKFADNWKITFRAKNLTNAIVRNDFVDPAGNTSVESLSRSGIDFSIGISGEWPK